MSDIIERSEIHATFVIERSYPVPVTAVWHALSDNEARDQWFGGGAEFDVHEKSHDFRVGGHGDRRRSVARWAHVAVRVHLHRHRRPAADGLRLRHVGR